MPISDTMSVLEKIATHVQNMEHGSDPRQCLECLAFNVGMRDIETVGDIVSYDPFRHEDMVGGYLRGDNVTVVTSGWLIRPVNRNFLGELTPDQPEPIIMVRAQVK